MAEKLLQVSENLKQLCFDSADYVCLKLIISLNKGGLMLRTLNNKQHLYELIGQAHDNLFKYCQTSYPNIPKKYDQLLAQISSTCRRKPPSPPFFLKCSMQVGDNHSP